MNVVGKGYSDYCDTKGSLLGRVLFEFRPDGSVIRQWVTPEGNYSDPLLYEGNPISLEHFVGMIPFEWL